MNGSQSEYDMSFNTFGRINYALWHANDAQNRDDIDAWFRNCKILFKELVPLLEGKDLEKHLEMKESCHKAFVDYTELINNFQNSPRHLKKNLRLPRGIFDTIEDWDVALRIDLKKKGILLKQSRDAGSIMASGN